MPDLTAGEQKWDYLYSADAADALYRMACHGRSGAVYPVGSGTARPLREYIETLRDAIDLALPLGLGKIPYGPQQVMFLHGGYHPACGRIPALRRAPPLPMAPRHHCVGKNAKANQLSQ